MEPTADQERMCDEMAETQPLRAAVAWRFFQGKGQLLTELTGVPLDAIEKFVKDGELSERAEAAEAEVSRLRADGATLLTVLHAILNDEPLPEGGWPHLLICNYQSERLGDEFCNCPLGKRIYDLKRDGATLRERVKKLPSPLSWHAAGSDGEGCEAHIYCAWCGYCTPADSASRESIHHDNCLYAECASAPKEPTDGQA